MHARTTIRISTRAPLVVESTVPDEDELAAFLHRLRPFLLQGEECEFHSTLNLLYRAVEIDDFRLVLADLRNEFTGKKSLDLVKISVDGTPVNDDAMFNAWLNVFEYHRDEGKRAERVRLLEAFGAVEKTRGIFINLLAEKARAIQKLGLMIGGILRRDGRQLPPVAVRLPNDEG